RRHDPGALRRGSRGGGVFERRRFPRRPPRAHPAARRDAPRSRAPLHRRGGGPTPRLPRPRRTGSHRPCGSARRGRGIRRNSSPPGAVTAMRSGEVAVVGRPNVGKSTLVNRLVGEKVAIVSDKPQTTRKRILGVARRSGAEIALVDTPGIHRPEYRMNAAMVREATDALSSADLVLLVVDASERRGKGEAFLLRLLERAGVPAILALNKIDRIAKSRLLPLIADLSSRHAFVEVVPISALTGDGVDRLGDLLAANLPEREPADPE